MSLALWRRSDDDEEEEPPPSLEMPPGYEMISLLRRGRRLDTFDVYSLERDCRCVLKALREERRHERAAVESLMTEGCLLRDLAHPNLVRAYEVLELPRPAIVLETLSGATLAAVIEDQRLGEEDSVMLGLQLVSVLGYLHRNGYLHLDVKPSNIVVRAQQATLIDLSLAAQPGAGTSGAGTLGYLAPEQAHGEPLGEATDVWGVGVTLGECLTGRMAYGDDESWDRRYRLRPRRLGRRFTWTLERRAARLAPVVLSCLERSPADRPTLAELRAALTPLAAPTPRTAPEAPA